MTGTWSERSQHTGGGSPRGRPCRRAPELVRYDEAAKLVVTRYLPGELVLGHPSSDDPDIFRQAGALLAALHARDRVVDDDHEGRENARAVAWLASPHRIAPAATDLARLAARDFARAPALERAFLEGYGADPREPEGWRRICIREAIATAAWAYHVGDQSFEQEGLRSLEKLLD